MQVDNWGGAYSLTNEAKQSVEEDIMQLIESGKMRGETKSGGTFEKIFNSDGSSIINLYESSNSKKGYSHIRIYISPNGSASAELVHR